MGFQMDKEQLKEFVLQAHKAGQYSQVPDEPSNFDALRYWELEIEPRLRFENGQWRISNV